MVSNAWLWPGRPVCQGSNLSGAGDDAGEYDFCHSYEAVLDSDVGLSPGPLMAVYCASKALS
jgi:hypothetical protein